MSKSRSAVLILCMSTFCLSGCDLIRVAGPCYGVGCPSGTAGGSGQYKPGEAPKPQNASAPVQVAPAPSRTAAAPSAAAQPKNVRPMRQHRLHPPHTRPSSRTSATPSVAAQTSSAPVETASASSSTPPAEAPALANCGRERAGHFDASRRRASNNGAADASRVRVAGNCFCIHLGQLLTRKHRVRAAPPTTAQATAAQSAAAPEATPKRNPRRCTPSANFSRA